MVVPMAAVLLGFLLLVVLMEGEPGAPNGDGSGDPFLDLVRPGVLRISLLRLVLLVQCVGSGCDGAELGELLHVLVMLLLLPVIAAGRHLHLGWLGLRCLAVVVTAHEVVRHEFSGGLFLRPSEIKTGGWWLRN